MIAKLFEDQAAQRPDSIAVVWEESQFTYEFLDARAENLARQLRSLGVGANELVGIYLDRSLELIQAMLGVLKAGAAYVPLDPSHPAGRVQFVVKEAGISKIVVRQVTESALLDVAGVTWVGVNEQGPNPALAEAAVTGDDLAYVIYTSGSTGQPKGSLITHSNVARLFGETERWFAFQPSDVWSFFHSSAFDFSVWEIWGALLYGGRLIIVPFLTSRSPEAFYDLLLEERVTMLSQTPSAFGQLRAVEESRLGRLAVRCIVFGGERLDPRDLASWFQRHPPEQLQCVNMYGITETTVHVTYKLLSEADVGNGTGSPIGRPIPDLRLYILSRHGGLQPPGNPGEIYVGGAGLSRGYLNRPDLTAERFVPDPFSGIPGSRLYRTGDVGRWRSDRSMEYVGRNDRQVKIRGFRIEPAEIEARLNTYPRIRESAVIVQSEGVNQRLIAFYRANDTQADHIVHLPNEELRGHLLRMLPDYMVPVAFISMPAIPLNANGKVDRAVLERMEVAIASGHEYVAPRNDIERQLVEIWADRLNLTPEKIGMNDSFFELGGHSLLATQVITDIRRRLNTDLPLKALFERASVAHLAELIAQGKKSYIPAIQPVDRGQFERLPLSFAQERLWFIQQLEPESPGYNLPAAVTVRGELDISQLEEALNLIIARHENLRTVFPSQEGQPQQLILDNLDFKLERIDLSQDQSREASESRAKEICQIDAATPFDLARGPLFRGKVIKLGEQEHILMFNMHHIISDAWSQGVLMKELGLILEALAQGRRPESALLPIQYVDYSVWQRQWLEEGGVLKEQLAYWQAKLAGVPESLELATDYPRPSTQSFAGATHEFALNAHLTEQLKHLAQQQGGTLYMVLLATLKVLLYRYTGQSDICVGTPIANRQYGETEALIGMFVNTLALRTQVEGEDTFVGLLSKVKATCLEAYENQDAPFEKVVDMVRPQRNMAISAIFQVMVTLQNAEMSMPEQRIQPYLLKSGISKFDLSFDFAETREGLVGSIEYSTALYREKTIDLMVEHLIALCGAITATPTAKIYDLDYMGEAEKHSVLVDYNDTGAPYPRDKCIHELFAEQAAINPDKTAVVFGEQELTYQQLYERSQDLALYLQCEGVKPDSLVALCMERSLDMVVGLLGILQAGGAYVPLDPAYPDERLAYMLRESQATIVLTQEQLQSKLNSWVTADTRLVALNPQIDERIAELKALKVQLNDGVEPHHLAYVIYTSGSTGKPKGVMVEHRSLVNYAMAAAKKYQITSSDRMLQFSSLSFDAAAEEIFSTLARGATLVLRPNDLLDTIESMLERLTELGITVLSLPTAAWHAVVVALEQAATRLPKTLRVMIIGGERALPQRVNEWRERVRDNVRLLNSYGPTEATIAATVSDLTAAKPDVEFGRGVSIGKPLANTTVYVLDPALGPVPVNVRGEVYIGGTDVARGYLGRPDLTAERFLPDLFGPAGTRMYRSGDLVRFRSDGELEFVGRADEQVKIRGYRIELGEIEAQINQHPEIENSVVIAQDREGDEQLIAFYRAKKTQADQVVHLPYEELSAHLLRALPQFMVPAAFVSLTTIPLNANGKVDRRTLARMDVTKALGREYEAPRNHTEKQLVDIWGQVLNVKPEKIGVSDSFFELGGHSLLATQIISKIRSEMGVELPLKSLFERSSIAQLAPLIAKGKKSGVPAIQPVDRTKLERLPLSYAQERLWFLHQLEPASAGYNIPEAVSIRGELDIRQLEQAFNLIIVRHESLRTVFPIQDGLAQQLILDQLDFKLEHIDLSHYPSREERDGKAKEICRTEARTPFDLGRGPLLRGKVIKMAERNHILMLNMHHIISDGWSAGVMVKELGLILEALQEGRDPELSPLPIQYVDYSVWQRRWLEEDGVLKQQLAYWQEKLGGVAERLDLATDYPRPNVQRYAGATREFALDEQLTAQLKSLTERQGCTLFMVLLAACKVLLHRYTGQNDICVGSPIANRQNRETDGLIGMFVNTLALRSQIHGEDTFADLLSQVKATCLEAYEHQDTPFEKVVDAVCPERNLAISPIFQVMVTLQNTDFGAPDPRIQRYPLESGISKFDLSIHFMKTAQGLAAWAEYSTALYKPHTIERMVEHFIGLCRAITVMSAGKIRDLDYLGETEKYHLLTEYNDTLTEYPKDKCIHELFAEQVGIHPEKIALVCGEKKLSYRELYGKSCDLALYLQSLGVKPDSIVGLYLERSFEMMVGIMGTEQAGGAYLPLDPAYPDERLAHMLQDSQAAVVLTQEKFKGRTAALVAHDTRIIVLDTEWPEINKCVAQLRAKSVELRKEVRPRHLSYLIYTSGSTGKPKGVQVEHQALVNRIHWMQKRYGLTPADVVLQKTPYSFDVSVWEFFWPMMAGASVVFAAPDEHKDIHGLENLIEKAQITTLHYVPSMLRTFLHNANATCGSVRQIFCSGEALDKKCVDEYRARFPNAVLHNLYGPTEAAIDVTAYDCSQLDYPFVPIGAPIDNIQIYILDQHDKVQPIGIPGELHIAGDGLARGYLNRPELTQEKFVVNPFNPGTLMYKTGDLARWLDDGNIQYLGRIDTQVKIRGYRIELGEIETRLNEHPEIEDSAVIVQGQEADKRLIAFYRTRGTRGDHIVQVANEELRDSLLRTLPEYMVPTAFVSVAAIPLNPNGKVDRRALAQMDVTIASGREYVPPRNDTERQLIDIWAQVLKLAPEKIGVNDSFFELGGHSLLATQMIAKIRSRLDIDLPLTAVFEHTRVAQLAGLIAEWGNVDGSTESTAKQKIPPILRVPRNRKLPLSFAQQRLWLLDQLEPGNRVYHIPTLARLKGELKREVVSAALDEMVCRHEILRTCFPATDGLPYQMILSPAPVPIEKVDLRHIPPELREESLRRLANLYIQQPFDLAQGPLFRVALYIMEEQQHVLCLVVHHIICDAWSVPLFVRELNLLCGAFLKGETSPLPELPVQYADVAVWEREWLQDKVLESHLRYWLHALEGAPQTLDLPTEFSRPSVQSFDAGICTLRLSPELSFELKELSRRLGATEFMVLLALMNVWLFRYSGQSDILVGAPVSNRHHVETQALIGLFVDTVVFRTRIDAKARLVELVDHVRLNALGVYAHQALPFERLVEELHVVRDPSRNPLFQVMFNMITEITDGQELVSPIETETIDTNADQSRFDIHLNAVPLPGGLELAITYKRCLFQPATVTSMLESFAELIRLSVENPELVISELVEKAVLFEQESTRARRRNQFEQQVHQLRTARRRTAIREDEKYP